jgi:hypothetical protein
MLVRSKKVSGKPETFKPRNQYNNYYGLPELYIKVISAGVITL